MKKLLAALLLVAAPALAIRPSMTYVNATVDELPSTCVPGQLYSVTDGADAADCVTGNGTISVTCSCDRSGQGYSPISSPVPTGTEGRLMQFGPGGVGAVDAEGTITDGRVCVGNAEGGFDCTGLTSGTGGPYLRRDLPVVNQPLLVLRSSAGATMDGDLSWDSSAETMVVGDDGVGTLSFYPGAHTTDTNANTICTGTDVYLDGEGNCDTLSSGSGDITAVGSMTSGDAFADSTADDDWLGLGASAGRIVFDNLTDDEVQIQDGVLRFDSGADEKIYWLTGLNTYGEGIQTNTKVSWIPDFAGHSWSFRVGSLTGTERFNFSYQGDLTMDGDLDVAGDIDSFSMPTATGDKVTYYNGGASAIYGTGISAFDLATYAGTGADFTWRENGRSGTEFMRLDTAGPYLGIGTSTPGNTLELNGGGAIITTDTDGAFYSLVMTNESDAANTSGLIYQSFKLEGTDGVQKDAARIRVEKEQAWTATASTRDSAMSFWTTEDNVPTQRLRIDSAGVLTLTPIATAPATCSIGDLYVDTSGAYCACTATNTWSNMTGTGTCT